VTLINENSEFLVPGERNGTLAYPSQQTEWSDDVQRARGECYSHAFFQALSQMLCIGYGLVNPKEISELWITIIMMITGAGVYSISLSVIVNIFSSVDHPSKLYKNTMEVLEEFMRVKTLPTELRVRLRGYFQAMYPNRRIFNERGMIGEFSYPLRFEIRLAACASLFARTPIFENADAALLSAICPRLSTETAMPGDWLAREDEVLTYVVFIDTGKVEVLVDEQHVADMGDGSYLGEISALGLGGEAGRGLGLATASVRAQDVCSIHVLAKADFVVLMRQFPDVLSAIQAVAQLRLARACSAKVTAEMTEQSSGSGSNGNSSFGGGRTPTKRRTINQAYADKMAVLTDTDVNEYSKWQQVQASTPRGQQGSEGDASQSGRRTMTGGLMPDTPTVAQVFWRILTERDSGGDRSSVSAPSAMSPVNEGQSGRSSAGSAGGGGFWPGLGSVRRLVDKARAESPSALTPWRSTSRRTTASRQLSSSSAPAAVAEE